jgi:hypothetical protein
MFYQRRVLILNLALLAIGMGATVGCRAERVAAPRAAFGSQSTALLLCTAVFSRCDPAVLSSQTTTRSAERQSSIAVRPSQLASGTRGANVGWQTSDRSVSGRNVNISEASTGADTNTNMGRLSLNVTLDSYYHGAIYNIQAPFEPMQVSLNYSRTW